MKKLTSVFIILALTLCACGGTAGTADTVPETMTATAAPTAAPAEAPTEIPTEAMTAAPTEAPTVPAGPVIASGDGILESEEQLYRLYLWLDCMESDYKKDHGTYEFLRDFAGVEAEDQGTRDSGLHGYRWYSPDGEKFLFVNLKENKDGLWTVNGSNTSGFVSKDIPQTMAVTVDYGDSGFHGEQTGVIRHMKKEGTVTLTLPETGSWVPEVSGADMKISNAPGGEYSTYGCPWVKITIRDTLEAVNLHQEDFEALRDLPGRTVGGIEMVGRAYRYMDRFTTEYYGELPDVGWFSVKLVEVEQDPGSPADVMLDSIRFS